MDTLTVKDFASKVKSKKDLYEAVQRNGYHLPSLKSTLVTENYLINVMMAPTGAPRSKKSSFANARTLLRSKCC